jgi:hypothetical protein
MEKIQGYVMGAEYFEFDFKKMQQSSAKSIVAAAVASFLALFANGTVS